MPSPYDIATTEAILKTKITNPSYDLVCEWINWLYGAERITGETQLQYENRMFIYREGIGAFGNKHEQDNNRERITGVSTNSDCKDAD